MAARHGLAVAGRVGWRQPGVAVAFNPSWFLVLPAFAIFLIFFVIPVLALLAIAFNPAKPGVVLFQPTLTLANFTRWLSTSLYYNSAFTSIMVAVVVVVVTLILIMAIVLGNPGSVAGAGLSARGRPGLRSLSLGIAAAANVVAIVVLL